MRKLSVQLPVASGQLSAGKEPVHRSVSWLLGILASPLGWPAIDAGDPRSAKTSMRINVMHPARAPMTVDSSSNHRLGQSQSFTIVCSAEVRDFERPHLATVLARAILREAYQPAIEGDHAPGWPGTAGVVFDDGTGRMLFPRSFQMGRTV